MNILGFKKLKLFFGDKNLEKKYICLCCIYFGVECQFDFEIIFQNFYYKFMSWDLYLYNLYGLEIFQLKN